MSGCGGLNHIFLEFVKKCFSGIKMKMFFLSNLGGGGQSNFDVCQNFFGFFLKASLTY